MMKESLLLEQEKFNKSIGEITSDLVNKTVAPVKKDGKWLYYDFTRGKLST